MQSKPRFGLHCVFIFFLRFSKRIQIQRLWAKSLHTFSDHSVLFEKISYRSSILGVRFDRGNEKEQADKQLKLFAYNRTLLIQAESLDRRDMPYQNH